MGFWDGVVVVCGRAEIVSVCGLGGWMTGRLAVWLAGWVVMLVVYCVCVVRVCLHVRGGVDAVW